MNIDYNLSQALERASNGLKEKMLHSIQLLRKAERIALSYDNENGFYLAFSGGKDSQALYHITQLAGVRFHGHMNLTSVDPPEVIRFVKKNYPEVELIKPKKSIFSLAVEKQILPTMRVRWCCAEYKETASAGKVTLIGIRKAESARRAKRSEVEINNRKFSGTLEGLDEYRQELKAKRARRKSQKNGVNITNADQEQTLGCISGKESLLISPIIHWNEQDVWEFLNKVMEVPHCPLYDEGWHRLGCIGCPMSSAKQKQIENTRYPHVKRNWIKVIKAIRGGQNSFQTTSGGTSEQIGSQQEKSEDCSGRMRLDSASRPRTLGSEKFYGGGRIGQYRANSYQKDIWTANATGTTLNPLHQNRGAIYRAIQEKNKLRSVERGGFSQSSSSDRLTDEQREDLIAENIYDWWISGKSYKKWYADKFLQLKFEFEE